MAGSIGMKEQQFSSLTKNRKKNFWFFRNYVSFKIETQKIINLLNHLSNEKPKFSKKNWYVVDVQTAKNKCSKNDFATFEIEAIKSFSCGYLYAYIIVAGDITVNARN